MFDTYVEIELLDEQRLRLSREIADLRVEVDALRRRVEAVAVDRFVVSGTRGIPVLTDPREPGDRVQADVMVQVAAETGATSIDDYDEARRRLRDKRSELDDVEAELEATIERLEQEQVEAEREVERLREIESRRLQDEAIEQARIARERDDERQAAELERRLAELQRRGDPVPGRGAGLIGGVDVTTGSNTSNSSGASGSIAGGRTGGGGPGNTPPVPVGVFVQGPSNYVDAIVCPVQGFSAYGDTWGAPRSGGRRHQGVDMLAPTGTPLQAVVSGVVSQRSNRLGGVTISLLGDNGNRYYYAHLSAYEGAGGRVEQGQVIGYMGDTGNATGVPHLHFEIRPGNGVPVNPTPSVRAAGC